MGINGHKRSKPTTIRFWPDDDAWVRKLALSRRVPVNRIVDEAVALYRKKIEAETSQSVAFEAVAGAKKE